MSTSSNSCSSDSSVDDSLSLVVDSRGMLRQLMNGRCKQHRLGLLLIGRVLKAKHSDCNTSASGRRYHLIDGCMLTFCDSIAGSCGVSFVERDEREKRIIFKIHLGDCGEIYLGISFLSL